MSRNAISFTPPRSKVSVSATTWMRSARDGIHAPPQLLHPVAVDPSRARPQLRWIGEVGCADLVHPYLGFGESGREGACGPRMIEMYVGDEDPIEMIDAGGLEPREDVRNGGLGPGLHERDLVGAAHHEDAGDSFLAVHLRVYEYGFGHVEAFVPADTVAG